MGTLTEPSVALTVPCAEMHFDQTGKPIAVRSRTSRTPGVDDQPDAAARHRRGCKQVAEIAVVTGTGRGEDENVAGLQLLDGDVEHPVVARRRADRHRRPGDPCAGVDRAHDAAEHPGARLRFVDGGDAGRREDGDRRGVGARDGADDNSGHDRQVSNAAAAWARDGGQASQFFGRAITPC